MWEDGALFQEVMNQNMGDEFPSGVDPTDTSEPLSLSIQNLLHPGFNSSSGSSDHPDQHLSLQGRADASHRT